MKRFLFVLSLVCISGFAFSQQDTAFINGNTRFQSALKAEYDNPYHTPLSAEAKKTFRGIRFYPVNEKYAVKAQFVRTPGEKPFRMSTSSGMLKTYIKYAEVLFIMDNNTYKLNVYQSQDLMKSVEYKDYLFIPFTDATSGNETYKGGRYIDLSIPQDDYILLDFNKAYHPYCAYTEGYNCPVPPQENTLPIKIEAGVKF